eukprot:jgi/Undpi1/13184/HiC_scaffold_8.g02846.m1
MAVPGGTAVPHFNVWVTREAGLPLVPELVRRLPGSVGYDPESKNMLKNQADAQVEMTMEEVIAVIAAEDAREQRTPTKDFTGFLAFVANAHAEKTAKGPAVDLLTGSRKSGSPAFWVTLTLECGMAVPGGTAIPHFNVWVTREAGLPLFPELDFTGFLAFVANAHADETVKGPAVLKWMSAALGLHLQQWPP